MEVNTVPIINPLIKLQTDRTMVAYSMRLTGTRLLAIAIIFIFLINPLASVNTRIDGPMLMSKT